MQVQPWEFSTIWNNSLLTYDQRKLEPRDYMYASEIGGAFVDRYLKMQGKKPSNPPNDRSLRKFQAGNLFEWIIQFVLQRAGIMQDRQVKVKNALPGCLEVSGKMDFVCGGTPDWERAEREVTDLGLPGFLGYASLQIIGQLRAKYKDAKLEECVFEAKSNGSFVFDKIEYSNKPLAHNAAQTFFYVSQMMLPGKLTYICRDDCRLKEFRINILDREYFEYFRKDCEQMTDYYRAKKIPPKEQEFIFDEDSFRFRHNWKVEYSSYLTLLYGYKSPMEYRDKWDKLTGQFNRVFKRCMEGANLTKDNLEIIKEAKKRFKTWDTLVEKAKIAKAKGALIPQTEEVEV